MIKSAEEFVRLRLSEDPAEYGRAATDEATETVWLDVIDRFPDMRKWVALNKKLPKSILWKLIQNPDPDVRSTVADRRQLTDDMFAELAKDTDEVVRSRVCCNGQVPRRILEELVQDQSTLVAESARRHLR